MHHRRVGSAATPHRRASPRHQATAEGVLFTPLLRRLCEPGTWGLSHAQAPNQALSETADHTYTYIEGERARQDCLTPRTRPHTAPARTPRLHRKAHSQGMQPPNRCVSGRCRCRRPHSAAAPRMPLRPLPPRTPAAARPNSVPRARGALAAACVLPACDKLHPSCSFAAAAAAC
ncbi:MAG: hypothetical protein J3K34DRAFT_433085 [Monoraphidium minutum]|nr:MAG: hypothetical protein J3K34DRAFT_433085 [Monoraphidium minutum]